MRGRSCAALLALALLLAGPTLAAPHAGRRRSLLEFADSAGEAVGTQYTGDGGANYVGTVSTIACDCGFISEVGYTTTTGDIDGKAYVTEVGIRCRDTVNARTLPFEAGTYFTADNGTGAALDPANAFASGAGFNSFSAAVEDWGIVSLSNATGDVLACGADALLYGLTVERNDSSGVVMRLSGACASPEDLLCSNVTQVDCQLGTTGRYFDNSTGACEDCPPGMYAAGDSQYTADCVPCEPGTFRADPAATDPDQRTACASCELYHAAGDAETQAYYARASGSQNCQKVPAGYWLGSPASYSDPVPCGPGLVGRPDGSGCVPCPAGYYREGEASPNSNTCALIPAGYYASAFAKGQPEGEGASAIAACPKGSSSSWSGGPPLTWEATNDATQPPPAGARVPASSSMCQTAR